MEDEVCYSTVIFKAFDNDNDKSKELQSEEPVLYGQVKRKESTSEVPPKSSAEQCTVKKSALPPQYYQAEEKGMTASPSYRRATVFLGLLCFLLLSALTAVSILNYSHVTDYNKILSLYNEERTVNQQLLKHKDVLERETKRLSTQGEDLNGTLDFILKQSTFSVEEYCHSTGNGVWCKPCPRNWIQNGSSCYYFYLGRSWKTWMNSQDFCKEYGAHLAIIDNVEEQEFVNQHTELYYDTYHGYWIGLSEKSGQTGTWVWTSGAELKGGFWIDRPKESYMYCVLSMTSRDSMKSWQATPCQMYNRWICEMTVLPWPTFLRAQTNNSSLST